MCTDPRRLALAALLVLHGAVTIAPAGTLAEKARLTQGVAAGSTTAEELPTRPRINPLRGSAAAPGPSADDGEDAPSIPATGSPRTTSTPSTSEGPTADPGRDGAGKGAREDGGKTGVKAPCGKAGCASCTPQVATCRPKWEDKKSKKVHLAIRCEPECVRPWEPYHQGACCEEKTTPCGDVRTRKRLYKTEEDKCERVLKYEVVMKPAAPCCPSGPACGCLGCRSFGPAFERLFGWCH